MASSRYIAMEAAQEVDIAAAQALRARCFGLAGLLDRDAFDASARHFIIKSAVCGSVVCCFRLTVFDPNALAASYSAQFYGLDGLSGYDGRMMELGRFCVDPEWDDPDILRLAWGALTRVIEQQDVQLLFGCSSFAGVDVGRHSDAFAVLAERHIGPAHWLPAVNAPEVFRLVEGAQAPDFPKGMREMPPLLRSYLMMGGWVGDHGVIDRHMDTLHVFTVLEIGVIPERRKRLLRMLI